MTPPSERLRSRNARRAVLIASVALAFLVADATIVWIGARGDFAIDFTCCYQQAGQRALTDPASLYDWTDTYTFRYTPPAALLLAPLAPLSEEAAVYFWLAVKLLALAVAAAWYSAPWRGLDRWLVAAAVVSFPPIVHDLVLGNVSTFTVLVLVAALRWQDWRGGLAIFLFSVLMPKPHLLPILAWMVVRRPRDSAAGVLAALAVSVASALTLGLGPWLGFLASLREPLERTFTANVGFSAYLGAVGVAIGIVFGIGLLVVAVRRRDATGFGLSIVSGIVLGPYTFIHYLAGTLVAAEPILRRAPTRLVAFPWLLIVFPLIPVWLLALAALLLLEQPRAVAARARQSPDAGTSVGFGDPDRPG